jgi:uncharacterized protein YneF (UPF0154 family)
MDSNITGGGTDIAAFYFNEVQEEIKRQLADNPDIKEDQIQEINDNIFLDDDSEQLRKIREQIESAASNNVDVGAIAREILSKKFLNQFVNVATVDTINNVDNPMLDEGKLMKFEAFKNK